MGRTIHVDLGFEPRPHQREAHKARQRFSVLVWHRRSGKTVFAVLELVLAALTSKEKRARFAYIAPLYKQAKDIAWTYLKHYTRPIPGISVNESELAVTLPNGAVIRLYGADNPDALRGIYLDGVVLDEVADMKPQVWGEIIRPLLADRLGWALFIGTPKGINLFSELYFRALAGDEEWTADLRRASETGCIPAAEIEQARREMTPQQFAQEFECDFSASVENALITLESVKAAMDRQPAEESYFFAPRVLGVDVARTGGDRCAMFPRQGLCAFKPRAFRPKAIVGDAVLMEVAGIVAKAIDDWKPHAVFIDRTGLGHGVVDRLAQLQYKVIGVDFGAKATDPKFANKRAEMWRAMAGWVQDGGCLPNDHGLIAELTAPTFSYADASNRFALEAKDDIKERLGVSPDLADALALTFAAPVAIPEPLSFVAGARTGPRASTEYDHLRAC